MAKSSMSGHVGRYHDPSLITGVAMGHYRAVGASPMLQWSATGPPEHRRRCNGVSPGHRSIVDPSMEHGRAAGASPVLQWDIVEPPEHR